MAGRAKLVARRPLIGDYGKVAEGQTFECSPEVAESLELRGFASQFHDPEETAAYIAMLARLRAETK